MSTPVEDIAFETIAIIEENQVEYALMGGLAVRVWALPRATFDVDIQISCEDDKLKKLLAAFEEKGFYVPEYHSKGFVDKLDQMRKVKAQKYYEGHAFDIDVFIVATEFDKTAFQRRKKVTIYNKEIQVLSPEDLILYKLVAGRKKDLLAIEEIIMMVNVDTQYLRQWAKKLSVSQELEDILKDKNAK